MTHGNCSCPFSFVGLKKHNHFNLPLPPSSHTKKLPSNIDNDFQRKQHPNPNTEKSKLDHCHIDHPKSTRFLTAFNQTCETNFTTPIKKDGFLLPNQLFVTCHIGIIGSNFLPRQKKTGKTYVTELFHPMESISRLENAVTRS